MSEDRQLSLYHYDGCPFCALVREAIARLGVKVELRNTVEEPRHARDLFEATGRRTVPCLRIQGGDQDRWLHESSDIIAWLESDS